MYKSNIRQKYERSFFAISFLFYIFSPFIVKLSYGIERVAVAHQYPALCMSSGPVPPHCTTHATYTRQAHARTKGRVATGLAPLNTDGVENDSTRVPFTMLR